MNVYTEMVNYKIVAVSAGLENSPSSTLSFSAHILGRGREAYTALKNSLLDGLRRLLASRRHPNSTTCGDI